MQKGVIKLELNHYNTLSALNDNSKIEAPSPEAATSPAPAALVKV
jgi:hypothetical protein